MDGTFKSSSNQFKQIYTIHADLGSTATETNVAAVAFALLPNKKKETYVRMLQMILREVPDWKPETINIDFEASAVAALRDVFPDAKIQGCYFHFTQCLWRKVQDVGLVTLYSENEEIRKHIRMCAALAFLKPEDIDEGWIIIQETAPRDAKLAEFFDYFIEQWMENQSVPREVSSN